jgi:hypothetical protein
MRFAEDEMVGFPLAADTRQHVFNSAPSKRPDLALYTCRLQLALWRACVISGCVGAA